MDDIPKYIDCPECGGEGKVLIPEMWPSGHQEVWHECEFCYGEGNFEEADYIMMKLEGSV